MVKNKQSGFASVLITIVVLALVAGGIYYWQQNKLPALPQEPIVENQPPINDETKDWKTYRNEEYGFEFKYPQNWVNCTSPNSDRNTRLQGSPRLICIESNESTDFGKTALVVAIESSLKNQYPTYSLLKTHLSISSPIDGSKRIPTELIIGGYNVLQTSTCDADCWGTYFIFTKDDLIAIRYSGDSADFSQILSTFKFIN